MRDEHAEGSLEAPGLGSRLVGPLRLFWEREAFGDPSNSCKEKTKMLRGLFGGTVWPTEGVPLWSENRNQVRKGPGLSSSAEGIPAG